MRADAYTAVAGELYQHDVEPARRGADVNLEACDYSTHSPNIHQWTSVDHFCGGSWAAGVHVVRLAPGRHLDVEVGGDLRDPADKRALPVFFSGAVVPRAGKTGPFFSGAGIAERVSSPFIALSDPVVDECGELPLAWYTGRAGDGLQDAVAMILEAAQLRYGELLLVGGSGGGFAAILFADRIRASALVWNPQTDLLNYAPPIVRQYLAAATTLTGDEIGTSDHPRRAQALIEGGIQHSITAPQGPGIKRLLYLQSASDWHVGVHTAPFIRARGLAYAAKGTWTVGASQALFLAHFSSGHTPPPYQTIVAGVQRLLAVEANPQEVILSLQSDGLLPDVKEDLAPKDLQSFTSLIESNVALAVHAEPGMAPQLRLTWGRLPQGYGGMTATFRTSEGQVLPPLPDDPHAVSLEAIGASPSGLSATLLDGLGQPICNIHLPS